MEEFFRKFGKGEFDNEDFKALWNSRNPQHDINADTGVDMFWETACLVLVEYVRGGGLQKVKRNSMSF